MRDDDDPSIKRAADWIAIGVLVLFLVIVKLLS